MPAASWQPGSCARARPRPCPLPETSRLPSRSLAFNGFSGALPADWGSLSSLRVLKLNSNQLSGAVPKAWARPGLPALKTLSLWNNPGLTGCLPAALAGAGPSGQGYFQGPGGKITSAAKEAASGTKISGFC
jgi:hypothetical protein